MDVAGPAESALCLQGHLEDVDLLPGAGYACQTMLRPVRIPALLLSLSFVAVGCSKNQGTSADEGKSETKSEAASEPAEETDPLPLGVEFTADGGPFQAQKFTPRKVRPTDVRWAFNKDKGETQIYIKVDEGERRLIEMRMSVPAQELGAHVLDGGEKKLVPNAKISVRDGSNKSVAMVGQDVTVEFTRYEEDKGMLVGRFNGTFVVGEGPSLVHVKPEDRTAVTITDGFFKARYRPGPGQMIPEWATMWNGVVPEWQTRGMTEQAEEKAADAAAAEGEKADGQTKAG